MNPHQTRHGSFDTLRLLAALMVFHSHSFALAGLREPGVPGYSLGGTAVIIFFAMSGYWVSRSALERSLPDYAIARALRIVPGLFVCCLATIVLCALATSESVNDYLRLPATWRWMQNAFPFFVDQRGDLPGVFEDGAVHNPNGSLWTLPYEVFCYVLAAMAAIFGARGMRTAMAGAGVFAVFVLLSPAGPQEWLHVVSQLERRALATFVAAFFLGAALNGATERQIRNFVLVAGVGLLFTKPDPILTPLVGIALYGALAIWVGRRLNLDRVVTRGRDISYGVYIYAFPCQQLAVRAVQPHDGPSYALYYGLALVATVVLATLSWVLVEKPALGAKAQLAGLFQRGVGRWPLGRQEPLGETP